MFLRELVNLIGFEIDESRLTAVEQRVHTVFNKMQDYGGKMSLFFTTPVLALSGLAVKAAGEVEQYQTSFEVMLGSAELAKKAMADLFTFEAKTPFNLEQVMKFGQQLLIAKEPVENLTNEMEMLGNVAAGSADRMNSIVYVLGQVRALGYLQGQDIMQFTNALVPIRSALEHITGASGKQLQTMIEQRKITADMVQEALSYISSTRSGLMEKQSKTIKGLLSSLESSFFRLRVTIGNAIIESAGLGKMIDKFISFLNKVNKSIETLSPETKKFLFWVVATAAAIGPLLVAIAGIGNAILFVKAGLLGLAPLLGVFTAKGAVGIAGMGAAITSILIPLAAVVVAFLLIDDLINYFNGNASVTGDTIEGWKWIFSEVGKWFNDSILKPINDFWAGVGSYGKMLWDAFTTGLSAFGTALIQPFKDMFEYIDRQIDKVPWLRKLVDSFGKSSLVNSGTTVNSVTPFSSAADYNKPTQMSQGVQGVKDVVKGFFTDMSGFSKEYSEYNKASNYGLTPSQNGSKTEVKVESSIVMQVPPGTTEQQQKELKTFVDEYANVAINQHLRNAYFSAVGVK